jgi:starch phosphorylase
VWEARIGHVRLCLLDTDLPGNRAEDRYITHQLYGGDKHTRIQQEIVLGVGGMRALEWASSRRPTTSTRATPPSWCWSASAAR